MNRVNWHECWAGSAVVVDDFLYRLILAVELEVFSLVLRNVVMPFVMVGYFVQQATSLRPDGDGACNQICQRTQSSESGPLVPHYFSMLNHSFLYWYYSIQPPEMPQRVKYGHWFCCRLNPQALLQLLYSA